MSAVIEYQGKGSGIVMTCPATGERWEAGYLGTTAAQRDYRAMVAARRDSRRTALQASLRAIGDGSFDDVAAPGCIGEACDSRGHGGYKGDSPYSTPDITTRRIVRNGARVAVASLQRRAVLATARETERARRAAIVQPVTCDSTTPLMRLAEDIAQGRFVRPSATVSERVYIVKGEDSTIVTRKPPRQTRNYRRTMIDAPGYMVALERLVRDYKGERAQAVAAMQAAPSNEGRAALAHRAPDAVNGTQVRAQPLWKGSRPASVRGKNGKLIDRTCYRVMPDGRRVPFVTAATARKRQAASIVPRLRADAPIMASALPRVVAD